MLRLRTRNVLFLLAILSPLAAVPSARQQGRAPFQVEEATIASIHAAIQSGQTTCRQVVQAYIDRARAYNGVCTGLVTTDGATFRRRRATCVRARRSRSRRKTVAASTVFPDLDKYQGLPLDYGRMEPTVSDPSVDAPDGHARRDSRMPGS